MVKNCLFEERIIAEEQRGQFCFFCFFSKIGVGINFTWTFQMRQLAPQLENLVVVFSRSIVSDFLWPHGLQHARLSCPSLSSGICSNSHPLSQWCHPISVTSFFFCPQSFPASGSFLVNWLFTSGGRSIGASASASVLPMNIQGWFPLGLACWISLQSKGLSSAFSSTLIWKHQFFGAQPSLWSNSHVRTWLLENLQVL